jgi:hypothetical protein
MVNHVEKPAPAPWPATRHPFMSIFLMVLVSLVAGDGSLTLNWIPITKDQPGFGCRPCEGDLSLQIRMDRFRGVATAHLSLSAVIAESVYPVSAFGTGGEEGWSVKPRFSSIWTRASG